MPRDVIRSPKFLKQLSKLDKSFLDKVEKLILKIIDNPEIGKPLQYERKGTRETYLTPFRVSYSYDKSSDVLIFLNIYHKKKQ